MDTVQRTERDWTTHSQDKFSESGESLHMLCGVSSQPLLLPPRLERRGPVCEQTQGVTVEGGQEVQSILSLQMNPAGKGGARQGCPSLGFAVNVGWRLF